MELILQDSNSPTLCLNMIVKNESRIIRRLLDSVISIIDTYCICDTGSTDNTVQIIEDYFKEKGLYGKIIREPFKDFSYNRNFALQACNGLSDYVLFLDADIMLKNNRVLIECYENILAFEKDLVTLPFETEYGWNWVFRIFDFTQWLGNLFGMPFAIGGFQFWRTKAYWETGGYVESQKFAEDYWISAKCNPKKFMVLSIKGAWTSARRFKKKGIVYMIKVMIKSYFNRNNPAFFDDDQNYWK